MGEVVVVVDSAAAVVTAASSAAFKIGKMVIITAAVCARRLEPSKITASSVSASSYISAHILRPGEEKQQRFC